MGFLLRLINQLRSQVKPKLQPSALAISLNRYADGTVLDVEGDRALILDCISLDDFVLHDILPVEQTNVSDDFIAIKAKGDSLKL